MKDIYDLFISCDVPNLPIAKLLKSFLEKYVFKKSSVFVAKEDMSKALGENWYEEIRTALKSCKSILPIISPSSIVNPWVLFEAGAGLVDKRTIPLFTSEIIFDDLPDQFKPLQAEKLDTDGIIELCWAIKERLGYNQLPRNIEDIAKKVSAEIFDIVSSRSQLTPMCNFPVLSELPSREIQFRKIHHSFWMSGNTLESVIGTLGQLKKELEENKRGRINVELILPSPDADHAIHVASALDDRVLGLRGFKIKLTNIISEIKEVIDNENYARVMNIKLYESKYPCLHHYFAIDADGDSGPGYIWIDLVKYGYLIEESPHFPVSRLCHITGRWFKYFQQQWNLMKKDAHQINITTRVTNSTMKGA